MMWWLVWSKVLVSVKLYLLYCKRNVKNVYNYFLWVKTYPAPRMTPFCMRSSISSVMSHLWWPCFQEFTSSTELFILRIHTAWFWSRLGVCCSSILPSAIASRKKSSEGNRDNSIHHPAVMTVSQSSFGIVYMSYHLLSALPISGSFIGILPGFILFAKISTAAGVMILPVFHANIPAHA